MAKPPNRGVYKVFVSWQICQVMKYFQVVTNVAVTYKFSCWGRGRETAWRCLQNLQLLKNSFARLQIFLPAYKFLTCSRVVNGRGVPAPQVWCLQVLSLLTNFQTLYTVRHGPTHWTFFYFYFWLLPQVHQGIDPWGHKSQTEGFTILPCRLEDEVISCTDILYFSSS